MSSFAARLALFATLAWLAGWSAHAVMALERPLGFYAPICGSSSAPAPDGACPVCEAALAAAAGPLVPVFLGSASVAQERPPLRAAMLPSLAHFAHAPARAPPPGAAAFEA